MTADGSNRSGVSRLDDFFELSARGSTLTAEIRGGVVTFIAMAYIVVLNPIILSDAQDVHGHSLDFAQVSVAGVMTILFGLIARLPFAFAAGLGINSFLATTVVGSLTWPEAMGLVVINGIIIVVLAATGLRTLIFDAVPMQLKLAITAGIGAFILFIGLVDAGFIGSTGVPSPPLGLGAGGTGSISTVPTLVFVFTLLLTTVGRRTGQALQTPLIYGRDGDNYLIVASLGGSSSRHADGRYRGADDQVDPRSAPPGRARLR